MGRVCTIREPGDRWTAVISGAAGHRVMGTRLAFRRVPGNTAAALDRRSLRMATDPGIEGVEIVPLARIPDERGTIFHMLRRTDPDQARPFRTPWVPLVPILGVLFKGYMMYRLGWINWARLIIWLAIGLVVYFTYGQKHSKVQALPENAGK